MTSISWAFEIIEKFPDTGAHSGVCFGITIAFNALRNSLGFISNGFPRRLHFSKIEFRSEIIHFAWINLAIADLKLSRGHVA
jgi:hypothetical protein